MPRSKAPTNRQKLTSLLVKKVQPAARRVLYWDTVQEGFVLAVEPSGHKAFKLIYNFNGRPRWYTIGKASQIGLKEARQLARSKMADVIKGIDVQAEKMIGRRVGTFGELADRYVNEHAKVRNRSWEQADWLVRKYLLRQWKNTKVRDIRRSDVRAIFRRITNSGSPVLANQVLAAASAIFSWAIKEEVVDIPANPCHGIERNPTRSRERVLSDSEVPLFWSAFDEAGLVRGSALRMILLTGQRPGEVRHMRHEDIEGNWWTLPGDPVGAWPGTKNSQTHRVWLSEAAMAILDEFDEMNEGFVFRSARKHAIDGLDSAMQAICKHLGIGQAEKATPHDLRRSHGTTVTSLGFTREQMNRIQNHKEGGIGSVYDRHSYADENKRIQEAVASRIMELVEGTEGGNGMPLIGADAQLD